MGSSKKERGGSGSGVKAPGSGSGVKPAPAEVAQAAVMLKNDELEAYKALLPSKQRPALCTPTIDKAGAWSWRGKQLELIWDTMTQGATNVDKKVVADAVEIVLGSKMKLGVKMKKK